MGILQLVEDWRDEAKREPNYQVREKLFTCAEQLEESFKRIDSLEEAIIEQTNYLVSFLIILIERNNGKVIIENLKEFSNKKTSLKMNLDLENGRVTLETKEVNSNDSIA